MGLKVLSLFDGISCGMVALERAGLPIEKYVAYEIDEYAIKISGKNYPQIEHCGDVTKADFSQYADFDLLIGGSPCQDLSIAKGKERLNLDGKSKLFFEYVRAKNEMRPQYFLFENVASMNEESKKTISDMLGCDPVFIDSADFSAQSRPRLYWTNIPVLQEYEKSEKVLRDVMETAADSKYFYSYEFDFFGLDKTVCAKLHIKGRDVVKRVLSPLSKSHTLTCDGGGGHRQKKVFDNGRVRKLTPLEYERLQTLPDNYTACVSDSRRYTAIGNGWTVDVIAHILRGLNYVE